MSLTDQLAQELPPSGRYATTEAFLAGFPVSDKVKQVAAKIINSGQEEQAQAALAVLQRHEKDGRLMTVDALAEAAAAAGVVPDGLARLAVEDWLEETGRTVDPDTGEILDAPTSADAATPVANDAPKADKRKRGQLPDEFLNKLRQWRGHNDPTYWGLGDDVADAIVEMAGQFTQQKIFKAAAIETEYSIAEVRLPWETARAFDKQMRDEFGDVLTHQHFRVLRYVDDRAKQEGYLRWCLESADAYNGRPAPASILAKKVRRELGHEPPPPTFGELFERAVRAVENLRDHADTEVRHKKVEQVLALLEKVN